MTPWTGDQIVERPLPTHSTPQKHNKRIQTFMSQVGFESKIPVLEQAKTVHALRGPYTYESSSRVRIDSGSNEPNSSVCGSQSWDSAQACVVKLIRARLPSQARRAGLASQTRTCMGPFRPCGHYISEIGSVKTYSDRHSDDGMSTKITLQTMCHTFVIELYTEERIIHLQFR
jgi:hypothetical protein